MTRYVSLYVALPDDAGPSITASVLGALAQTGVAVVKAYGTVVEGVNLTIAGEDEEPAEPESPEERAAMERARAHLDGAGPAEEEQP